MSRFSALLSLLILLFAGCGSLNTDPVPGPEKPVTPPESSGITYQLLVYSFCDSDGDGCGDFAGISSRLDYLKSLGVDAIWLSPIHPASSYHGYDVTDYFTTNPEYGSEADFKALVDAAHSKKIKVYLDFVLNHTSKYHPWFEDARKSESSIYRDWYIFSTNPAEDVKSGKIPMIEKSGYNSGEWTKFSVAGSGSTNIQGASSWWYHSMFGSWMPDINYGPASSCESSAPFKELCKAADKWIGMGVDGFRLDAVKHIYHNANSNENPEFLRKFYEHCNASFKSSGHSGNIYMIGENFSEPSEVAPYYKGLPAFFEFAFWWRLKDAINAGKGSGFVGTIQNYQKLYASCRPDYVEATKLSNHDEDRVGNDFNRNASKMKLAGAVLLSCSGEPYIYQGEELGYWGSKSGGDEYVRAPVKWTKGGETASGKLNGKVDISMLSDSMSVEALSENDNSILKVYRDFGQARSKYKALAEGILGYCPEAAQVPQIAAWYRIVDDQTILAVHNFGSGSASVNFADAKLDKMICSNGGVTVNNGRLTLNAYSSALFLQ